MPPQSWASIVRDGPKAAAADVPCSAAPTPQLPQPAQSTIGLEKMLAAAIAAALRPFQEQFQQMQNAITQLQEETQCGLSEIDHSDMEDIEEKAESTVTAPSTSAPKKLITTRKVTPITTRRLIAARSWWVSISKARERAHIAHVAMF